MRVALFLMVGLATGCHGTKFGRLSDARALAQGQPGSPQDGAPGAGPGGPAGGNCPPGGAVGGNGVPNGGGVPGGPGCQPNGRGYGAQGYCAQGGAGSCPVPGQPCPQPQPQQPRDLPAPQQPREASS